MIGKMLSLGFDMATLPARMTFRGVRSMMAMPGDFTEFMEELRQASDEVALEIQQIMSGVDAEMTDRAAHLTPQQKQEAAEMALVAAEKHLGMAAVNAFRALWLAMDAMESLPDESRRHQRERFGHRPRRDEPVTIDQEP